MLNALFTIWSLKKKKKEQTGLVMHFLWAELIAVPGACVG